LTVLWVARDADLLEDLFVALDALEAPLELVGTICCSKLELEALEAPLELVGTICCPEVECEALDTSTVLEPSTCPAGEDTLEDEFTLPFFVVPATLPDEACVELVDRVDEDFFGVVERADDLTLVDTRA
jgi:hypothetical protein